MTKTVEELVETLEDGRRFVAQGDIEDLGPEAFEAVKAKLHPARWFFSYEFEGWVFDKEAAT